MLFIVKMEMEGGSSSPHEQHVRDPLLAAVNGKVHTLLTAICAAARGRRKNGE